MLYEWREIKTWPSIEEFGLLRYSKGDFKCWVSKTATVGEWATVGARATVGEWATVGEGAKVGARATVGEGAMVGARATVGEWAKVGEGATVGERATVGARAKVQHCLTFGPLGSRQANLHYLPELGIFTTGCFYGTEKELVAKVKATHKNNEYAKAYKAAIAGLKALAKAKGIKRQGDNGEGRG